MSKPTILCVDDDRNVLLTLRTQLMMAFPDYAIAIAESGEQALTLTEELLADGVEIPLMIADQIMPNMKGDQLLIEMHSRYPEVIKVMLTGQASAEDVGNVVNRGNLYRFMSKPWNETDLSLTVKAALERYEQEKIIAQQQDSLKLANFQLKLLNDNLECLVKERMELLQQEICDREDLEKNFRISETRNQAMIQAIPDLLLRVKPDGTCLECVLPRNAANFLPVTHHLSEVLTPQHLEAELKLFEQVLTTGEMGMIEHQLLKHGKITYEEVRVTACGEDELLLVVRDVSDRKKTDTQLREAELSLQKSEQRYRVLMDGASDAIFLANPQGNLIEVNQKAAELLGYSRDELKSLHMSQIHPPEALKASRNHFKNVTQNNFAPMLDSIALRKDGSQVPVEITTSRIEVDGVIIAQGIFRDISDRKKLELELAESEAKFRRLVEGSNDLIWSCDHTVFTYLSPQFKKLFGLEPDEWIGKEFIDLVHPDDVQNFNISEFRHRHQDGRYLWVKVNPTPIYDCEGIVIGYQGTLTDISDRKQREVELWQAHQELNYHIDNSPLATIIWDHEFRAKRWSASAEKIFGWKSEEVLGKNFFDWKFVYEPDILGVQEAAAKLLQSGQASCHNRNYRKDGSVIYCDWDNSVLLDEAGNLISMTSLVQDVSDRKLTELALKQSEAKQRALLSALPDLIMQVNREGIYLDFLPAKTFHVLGEFDTVIGASVNECFPPDLAEKRMTAIASALETNEMQIYEHDICVEGIWQTEECRVVVCGEDEVMVVVRDISDRKQSELALLKALEAIQELNSQLEHRVQERTLELFQARNFLQAIIDNLPVALFVKDASPENFGKYLLWNNTSEIIFERSKEQALNKTVHDLFPKSQSDIFHEQDYASLQNRQAVRFFEETINTSSIGERILHTIKVPIFDPNGIPQYLVCISEDITDRKQAELNLQESNERFRATFEQAAVGIVQADLDGKYVKFNQKIQDILGYSEAELLLKSVDEITHPDDIAADRHNFGLLLSGDLQTFNIEKRFIRKDGGSVWTNLSVSLARNLDGDPQYSIGIIQDISDRKQVEMNLTESEERFRATFEQAAIGIVQRKLEGEFVNVNQKFCDIVGYSETELLLKSFAEITHSDDLENEHALIRQLIVGDLSTFTIEKRYIRKDGGIVWASIAVALARDVFGEPQYLIGVVQDISDRKRTEEERDHLLKKISRLNFKLEQKVEERTQDLSEAIQDLKTTQQELILSGKMAVLGQLTASIAHEINTPLGVIRGSATNIVSAFNTSLIQLPILLQRLNPEQKIDFIDLVNFSVQQPSMSTRAERQLLQEWEEELDKLNIVEASAIAFELILLRLDPKSIDFHAILRSSECLEILQVAHSLVTQSQNIQSIQQEVDRAAKIVFALKTYSHHNQNDEKISINIIESIEVALTLYANRLKQGIEVNRRYATELPMVLGNPDQLTQVWVNLIDNAIYAIGEQGTLEIVVEPQADFLMIEITDSGSGIPVEYISRLFEPFFTSKPRGEGSGLGLDIVKQIILKHDGDIQVRSQVGQTTFSILLPIGNIDNV